MTGVLANHSEADVYSEPTQKPKAVVIISGGLDSTVLLYYVRQKFDVYALSFDYGQRHSKELGYAAYTCAQLGVEHDIIDLCSLQGLLKSSLTFAGEVPEGHYAADNMKATVVPNRNAIMLSIAYGYAISLGASTVFIGAHAGDHAIYPDCRPEFFASLTAVLQSANEWAPPVLIDPPFVYLSKQSIVEIGKAIGVPFDETWSCYQGGKLHCGRCGTCVERAEAFALAKVDDPTVYADADYWKEVTNA